VGVLLRRWRAASGLDGHAHRRLAEQVLQQLKNEATAQRYALPTVDPSMTFGALAARFIANAGPKSHQLERLKNLLPFFADIPIGRITKPLLRDFRQRRMAKRPIVDATVNRDVAVLRHLLYWAVDEQLLEANPLARLKLPRERRPQRPVLRLDEEAKLLAAAPQHLQVLITVAVQTGMRRGEILQQRWEHIELDRRLLRVTRSKTFEGEGREIPLTPRIVDLLTPRQQPSGIAFPFRGRPIVQIKTAWRHALKKAGIRHVRFHDLRHTFNTRLLEAGVLQEVRKALMGHVSGGGIHAVYTHIELPLKREAIARLEEWLAHQHQQHQDQQPASTSEGGPL
jgi:integrase